MSPAPPTTILVIDDDPAVRRAYGRLLERLGHTIVLRGGCAEARGDLLRLGASDVVILDQQMPGTCGIDFLEQLQAGRLWGGGSRGPAVLLITAFPGEDLRNRAARLGVTELIEKPVDAARLLLSVRAALIPPAPAPAALAEPFLTKDPGRSYTHPKLRFDGEGGFKEQDSMKKHGRLYTGAMLAAASVIVGMVLAGGLNLTLPGRAAEQAGAGDLPLHAAARAQMAAPQAAPGSVPASFADIAERVNPAVVSITAIEKVQPTQRGRRGTPGDPFEFFFGPQRRFQREPQEPHLEQSGGSGFLISDDGFILTNFHVVEDATQIRVNLDGDRRDYTAEIVGTDPGTDLALIKIDLNKKLPYLRLGDSEALRVGDWVLAVGNPLQYEHSVTVGVVSAKGRVLPNLSSDFSLDNLIQTDAAINFGNSGGPLVNLAGEAVGVNRAISSVGQGISFAIPINTARDVVAQLKMKGKVSRGYLGITLGLVTPEMQEAWGLPSDRGALVQEVKQGLPAAEAGVRRGDVIVAVDGKPVGSTSEVVRLVSARDPGTSVKLTVLRGGKEMTLTAQLADRPPIGAAGAREPGGAPEEEPSEQRLGITVEELTPQILQEIDLPRDTSGVVVTGVSRVSEAFEKTMGQGDVITEVNRVPIDGLAEYRREVRKMQEGGLVVFYVISPSGRTGGEPFSRYVTLRVKPED